MKFNIVITTQIHENYGAHDWDGKGECPQYWKAKGGEEYRHPRELEVNEAHDKALVAKLVEELKRFVTHCNNSFEEYVIDWELLPVGELTEGEKEQVSWYGSVKYPAKSPIGFETSIAA